jgi:Cys-rich repeat protein
MRLLIGLCTAGLLVFAGCKDPGCLRNSDCSHGQVCDTGVCATPQPRTTSDAGTSPPPVTRDAGSSPLSYDAAWSDAG